MIINEIKPPFGMFFGLDGNPLDAGFIYIGLENMDPESNPIAIYWDTLLSIPAQQPVRTQLGMPIRLGTPSQIYCDSNYSITVKDYKGQLVYTCMSVKIETYDSGNFSFSQAVDYPQGTVGFSLKRIVSIKDSPFNAKGDGVWTGIPGATSSTATGTDDTDAFIDAIASGVRRIYIPEGTFIVRGGFQIPSYMEFVGAGMEKTFIYMKSNSNSVMFTNAGGSGSGNIGVEFRDMTIHGNQYRDAGHPPANLNGNITNQCFNWNTGSGANIPGLTLRNVKITSFYGDSTDNYANYIYGSVWVEFNNVYIMDNMYPTALMLKTSDNIITGLYAAGNGGWGALPNIRIQGGADSRFIASYFGGGGCVHQVQVEGSLYNQFIGCTNDNTYGCCYRFIDAGGAHSTNNLILGGSASNADQSGTSSWAHVQFEDASVDNQVIGLKIANTLGNYAKYGIYEKVGSTCGKNLIQGVWFDTASKFTTSQITLRAGGLSKVTGCVGVQQGGFFGAGASTAVAQSLNNGSRTLIDFGTVDFDPDAAVTTGASWKYTAPVSGLYNVTGSVSFTGASSNSTVVSIYKNGSESLRLVERSIPMGSTYNEAFSGDIQLSAGDYINIQTLTFNSGMTLRSDAKHNWLRIKRVENL